MSRGKLSSYLWCKFLPKIVDTVNIDNTVSDRHSPPPVGSLISSASFYAILTDLAYFTSKFEPHSFDS